MLVNIQGIVIDTRKIYKLEPVHVATYTTLDDVIEQTSASFVVHFLDRKKEMFAWYNADSRYIQCNKRNYTENLVPGTVLEVTAQRVYGQLVFMWGEGCEVHELK